eukprot:4412308-Pyramimonas_sp.AAC.1
MRTSRSWTILAPPVHITVRHGVSADSALEDGESRARKGVQDERRERIARSSSEVPTEALPHS